MQSDEKVGHPTPMPTCAPMMATYDFKKGCAFIDRDGTREETTDFIQAEPHKGEGSSVLCKLSGVVCKVRCIYWALLQYASEEQQETDVVRKVPTNKSNSRQQRPTSAEHAHGVGKKRTRRSIQQAMDLAARHAQDSRNVCIM